MVLPPAADVVIFALVKGQPPPTPPVVRAIERLIEEVQRRR